MPSFAPPGKAEALGSPVLSEGTGFMISAT